MFMLACLSFSAHLRQINTILIFFAFVLILPLVRIPSGERRALCRGFIRAHRPDTSDFGIGTIFTSSGCAITTERWASLEKSLFDRPTHNILLPVCLCYIGSVTHLNANHGQGCLNLTGLNDNSKDAHTNGGDPSALPVP